MKKIGFIDYFLDEWHAEKYPGWIDKASSGRMQVAYAYGKTNLDGKLSNAEWSQRKGIQLLDSIEEVVEQSDYLVVLSPDHPEYHEELAQLALQSGKPTYIDKTFAPDRAAALRMFELAEKHRTPMYSTSALRFAAEYAGIEKQGIESIISLGPGMFANYAIHQVEPIVSLMGTDVRRVMWVGTDQTPALLIGYGDGRQAIFHQYGWECPFSMALYYDGGASKFLKIESDFFGAFIENLVGFFESGKPPVSQEETIVIATILEVGMKAAKTPYQWLQLP
ncbi:Gfo/Idh/MocA family oxidoreductase [Paenibacillus sp. LjRoot56]|uniref:Gfo/Idh/MocA family oxidoreductase n=1 Tax=Paenibacillus sp. LjRoot56 TaxID=3342333 RepID=UPI003ECF4CCA